MVRAAVPEIVRIVDITDHVAGLNPYYSQDSGAPASPLARAVPEGGGAIVETPCRQTTARTSDDQSGEERPAGGRVLAHSSLQRARHLAYAVRWRDVEPVGELGVGDRGRVGRQRLEKSTDGCG